MDVHPDQIARMQQLARQQNQYIKKKWDLVISNLKKNEEIKDQQPPESENK